jgi:hypothetical protein
VTHSSYPVIWMNRPPQVPIMEDPRTQILWVYTPFAYKADGFVIQGLEALEDLWSLLLARVSMVAEANLGLNASYDD